MKISAKVNYAIKAIFELALHYEGKRPLQVDAISRSEGIPSNFLMQILLRLKNSGLVTSARGSLGGYLLAKDPSQIRLADVIQAVDNSFLSEPRLLSKSQVSDQVINKVFGEAHLGMMKNLEINFENLMAEHQSSTLIYQI